MPSRVLAVRSDVASLDDLDALAGVIRERHGRLDLVFANAGDATFQPIGDITDAAFDHLVDTNLKGVFFTIQKSLPLLPDQATIVLNASWTLHRGLSGAALYAATKAAVHNRARTLAAELAPRQIRVNSVSPGYNGLRWGGSGHSGAERRVCGVMSVSRAADVRPRRRPSAASGGSCSWA